MFLKFYYLHIVFVLVGHVLATGSCKNNKGPKELVIDTLQHQLGNDTILIKRSASAKTKKVVYLQLHHNEETAEEATLQFLQNNPGTFYNIINNHQRNVTFYYNGNDYTFDPNRIYTKDGIDSTLKNLSSINEGAATEIAKLAQFIVELLPSSATIIAVHNNTDEKYSIKDYAKGGSLEMDAEEVYINPLLDTDDFILTTERKFFREIKEKNLNVILQSINAKDDGSLSVYSAKKGRKYINIEAEAGHLKEQLHMLKVVKDITD